MHPTSPISPPAAAGPDAQRSPWAAFGYVLLLPAAVMALLTLVLPTGYVILASFQRSSILGSGGNLVGLDNYARVLGAERFWSGLGLSVSLVFIPLLALLVLSPVLGVLLDRAGTWPRMAGRIVLSLPLALFSPVAFAAAWDQPVTSLTLPLVLGSSVFGAVCGVGLTVALATLRGRQDGPRTAGAVAAIAATAVLAVAVQTFSFPRGLGFGGRVPTVAETQFQLSFALLNTGPGAATATVIGLVLAVLGVVATLIAVQSRLSIRLMPAERSGSSGSGDSSGSPPAPGGVPGGAPLRASVPSAPSGASVPRPSAGRVALGVAALVTVVVLIVATQLPWLSELLSPGDRRPAGPRIVGVIGPWTHVNTWLPPFLGALVAVGAAFLGALGIGGLRPLGRYSEWLLLPFAPWLFVGMLPLSFAYFRAVNGIGLSGTFLGLVPPMLLSVPALVLLTLFFRGQSEVWRHRPVRTAGSFLRSVVLPALPLAGLIVGAVTLLGAQSLSWQMMVSRPSSGLTAPLALVGASRLLYDVGPGLTTPPAVVLPLLAGLVAAQIWYLDRIAIRTGGPAR